jgi:hypothetical protein
VTGGRNGVPPPTTSGIAEHAQLVDEPSSIAAAARPAPPIPIAAPAMAPAAAAVGLVAFG